MRRWECDACHRVLLEDARCLSVFDAVWGLRVKNSPESQYGEVRPVLVCSVECLEKMLGKVEGDLSVEPTGIPLSRRTRSKPWGGGVLSYEIGRTRSAGWDPPWPDPPDTPSLPLRPTETT